MSFYVDDLIFTRNSMNMLNDFKASIMKEFDMNNMEELHIKGKKFICQYKYTKEMLKKFNMKNAKSFFNTMNHMIKIE